MKKKTPYQFTKKGQTPDIIVVGAGAAGLMAAGQAAEEGARVLLLEKMNRPGKKIAISGKGRCNITNTADLPDFLHHFGKSGRFLRQAFHRFFTPELIDFFHQNNLNTIIERGGRIFPESGHATDVLKVFQRWLDQCGVTLQLSAGAQELLIANQKIQGVRLNDKTLSSRAVIIATGGASYPATGSTGDGYTLAQQAGHHITPIRPALVPLVTSGNDAGKMAGLQLRNIAVRVFIDNKKYAEAFGELTFMPYGLSGPVVLTLSGQVVEALDASKKVTLSLDLKPALDDKKLDARLLRDFGTRQKEPLSSLLGGLLPREMIPVALNLSKVPPYRLGGEVRSAERKRLRSWLKDFRLNISGYRPLKEAIVTAGGVDLGEINPRTMESKLVQGLYFAGELLDIQADTGGYNLQAAFSTGWLAGHSAAGEVVKKNSV